MKRAFLTIGSVLSLSLPAVASAQTKSTFQVETYEPFPAQTTGIGNLAGSTPLPDLSPALGLSLHVVDDPLQIRSNGDVSRRLVDDQLKAELGVGFGLSGWVDLGISLPVVLYQKSDDLSDFGNPDGVSGVKLADTRVWPRVRVLKPEWAGGVGAALLFGVYLPTGDTASFNGDGTVRVEPRLAVDWAHDVGVEIVANLGYQLRPTTRTLNYTSDDVLKWGLGTAVQIPSLERLSVTALLFGSATFAEGRDPVDLTVAAPNEYGQPIEGQLGARYSIGNVLLHGSFGTGLTSDVGAPDFRLLAGVEWTTQIERDRDKDGLVGSKDQCPTDAEDLDDFEDGDGCPDLDNDGDRILDTVDSCATVPEDLDGFEDSDGCPEPDNDGDGILDNDDRCLNQPGPPETMGCPPEDSDGDGMMDHEDPCPDGAEDLDGFEDDDGCPEPDNDGDGILDHADQCPEQPEVINANEDLDGCPDAGDAIVIVTADELQVTTPFDFGAGTKVRWRDRKTLDSVATALSNHVEISKVRIEARTAETSPDDKKKSLERASAIQAYLVGQGVAQERLEPVGLGGSSPIDPENPVDGVRLVIIDRVGASKTTSAPEANEKEESEEGEADGGFDFSEESE